MKGGEMMGREMVVMGDGELVMIGNRSDGHGCQAGWFYGCHIYFLLHCVCCVSTFPQNGCRFFLAKS